MKKITLSLLLASLALVSVAMPARRGMWKTAQLSNGKTVRVELKGDENLHYWQAADGQCYRLDKAGNATLITNMPDLKNKAKAKRSAKNHQRKMRTRVASGKQAAGVYSGQKKGLIVLVQFKDVQFEDGHNKELFKRVANEENFVYDDFEGSVKDYFKAQSNGTFELDFDVVGPITLANDMEYYGADSGGEGDDVRPGAMVAEALKAADKEVDFSLYDWNGDKEVEQVYILYAGHGQATYDDANTIWPHEWSLSDNDYARTLTLDNVILNTYACSSELNAIGMLDGIGTICHEFSHCLGLPDMYDTDDSDGVNFGMGSWDLMDYGGYNGEGYIPAGYTSYEKIFAGWLRPIELTTDTTITNMKALSENGEAYIIYNDNHRDEYYLLENRQAKKWDRELPNAGMLILHVDFNQDVWDNNEVNNDARRQRCTIFHADNNDESGILGMVGDTYPYEGNDSLTGTSMPAATLYNSNTDGRKWMNKSITKITQNEDGTMNFTFKLDSVVVNNVVVGDTLFYESFNQCAGTGGNDGKWSGSIATAPFVADNEGWASGTAAEYGAAQCAKFGTSKKHGMEVSPVFNVVDGSVITFKAAAWAAENTTLQVESGNANVTYTPAIFTLGNNAWTDCEIKVQGEGAVQLILKPSRSRFFLDEVLAVKPKDEVSTGIRLIEPAKETRKDGKIYSIDGRYLGTNFNALQRGIYIINGKKVVK